MEDTFIFEGYNEEATTTIYASSDKFIVINMTCTADECERFFDKDELDKLIANLIELRKKLN